ncbi:hypothetical protein [Flavobacterium sp.]|uniref:hypothetical protein n=1 Tax=Flavobacterium sp. TaxID=239 RepID=UPI00286D896C|nr:hypothetical protein [Flavobacterium sp.]
MRKTDLLIGTIIGFATTFLGVVVFFELFSDFGFVEGVKGMKSQGFLGKVITLGAILNIIVFFVLLKLNKELMARGVVLATILLALLTLFV